MRTCTVCRHEKRDEIDKALLRGTPLREIAGQHGTPKSALHRHKAHIAAEIAKNTTLTAEKVTAVAERAQAEKTLRADDLLGQVRALHKRALALLDRAEQEGKTRDALLAIREAASTLRLQGEVLGQIQSQTTVPAALVESLEWASFLARARRVLAPYSEAWQAFLAAVDGLQAAPRQRDVLAVDVERPRE